MCLAKGLTSGYLPLGAVVVTDKIAEYFNDNPMVIGLTYSAHPTLCAAALENLKIIVNKAEGSKCPHCWKILPNKCTRSNCGIN